MNCTDVREMLSAYIDGELADDQMYAIAEHLSGCGECSVEYGKILKVAGLLRSLPDVSIPAAFETRLKGALHEEKTIKASASKKRKWRTLSGIAAVFIIGIFSLTLYNHMDGLAPFNEGAGFSSGGGGAGADQESTLTFGDGADTGSGEEIAEADSNMTAMAPESVPGTVVQDEAAASLYEEEEYKPIFDFNSYGTSRHLKNATTEAAAKVEMLQSTRDKIAVDYYSGLLEKELVDFHYIITDCFMDEDGVWHFNIDLYTADEYNIEYIEKHTYFGQDGELWRKGL